MLAITAVPAWAGRRPVAIIPVENVAIQADTPKAAEWAIKMGAQRLKWDCQVVSPELVRCTYKKGYIVVDVFHGANTISARYAGSLPKLNYDPATKTIHPNYNKLVEELVRVIRSTVPPLPDPDPDPKPDPDIKERIRKLFELRDAGLITDAECDARRGEILESL